MNRFSSDCFCLHLFIVHCLPVPVNITHTPHKCHLTYLVLFVQQTSFVAALCLAVEVGGKVDAADVSGVMGERLEEHLVDEAVLRELLHHVDALLAHLAEVPEDVDLLLLLRHSQHRVDDDEGAGAADAGGAVHHHRTVVLLVQTRRANAVDEADQRARVHRHHVIGPGEKVVLHYHQTVVVLKHSSGE